jgi:hypothetical protein
MVVHTLREQSSFSKISAGGDEVRNLRGIAFRGSMKLTRWLQISMNDGKGVNVLQASQHLVQKGLNMLRGQILWRHNQLVQISINI